MHSGLSDKEYLAFLKDGFVIIEPESLTEQLHEDLHKSAKALYDIVDATKPPTAHLTLLGDNLRAQVPQLEGVLEDPTVVGAVQSILGPDYLLHPHHFVHRSGDADQVFHQDGNLPWNERGHYRSHHPDWMMLFYYPNAVTLTNGPTEVIPGSQYWTQDIETEDGWHRGDPLDHDFSVEIMRHPDHAYRDDRIQAAVDNFGVPGLQRKYITLKAGSVVLAHYDLIHRGSRSATPDADRFLYKFYLMRGKPSKQVRGTMPAGIPDNTLPVVKRIWEDSGGDVAGIELSPPAPQELLQSIRCGREDERVAAAYQLASVVDMEADPDTLAELENILCEASEGARRAAVYTLRAMGEQANGVLIRAAEHSHPGVRRMACFALGRKAGAGSASVESCLAARAISDRDDLVRSNAAYALGENWRWAQPVTDAPQDLIQRLMPEVEPNNTDVALLPRSTVRQNLSWALMMASVCGHLGEDDLRQFLELCLDDSDRYVQGFALQALKSTVKDNPQWLAPGLLRHAVGYLTRSHILPAPAPSQRTGHVLSR